MKSGICPKCGSHDVRTGTCYGYRGAMALGLLWHVVELRDYICPDCGDTESYVADLAGKRESIREKWPRVKD